MRRLGYIIIHFVELVRFFGFKNGFLLILKIVLSKKNDVIKVNVQNFKNSVAIRKADSDLEIFFQVFCDLQYDFTYFLNYNPKNIIDCGANVGYSALFFADKFPGAKIICVEPAASNFQQLEFNTRGYTDITLLHAGIWYKNGTVSIKKEDEWAASFEVQEINDASSSSLRGITIDQIAKENQFETIDILKIDIEGAEFELFSNNPHQWLSITKCIVIELHDFMKKGTSQVFFKEMAVYNWKTVIKGENIICFKD